MLKFSSPKEVIDHLRVSSSDIRITPQRRAVIQALFKVKGHFCADDIVSAIDTQYKDLLGLSKGTIYATLELMRKYEIIESITAKPNLSIEKKGNSTRTYFDSRLDPHINAFCSICETIIDIDGLPVKSWLKQIDKSSNWQIISQSLSIKGICQHCQTKHKQRIINLATLD